VTIKAGRLTIAGRPAARSLEIEFFVAADAVLRVAGDELHQNSVSLGPIIPAAGTRAGRFFAIDEAATLNSSRTVSVA